MTFLENEPSGLARETFLKHKERRAGWEAKAVPDRPIKLKGRFPQPNLIVNILDKSPETQPVQIKSEPEVQRDWLLVETRGERLKRFPPNFDRRIKMLAAEAFGVTVRDIEGPLRVVLFVWARHTSIHFCHQFTNLSGIEISRRHHKDNSVGIHALRTLPGRMRAYPWLCQTIVDLEARLWQEVAKWRSGQ